jgi:hypothetical protein
MKPWYIIGANNPYVFGLTSVLDFMCLLNVTVYLFFIAFGPEGTDFNVWRVVAWLECFYLIEILLHFFTAISDPETFQIITRFREIAKIYILKGHFFLEFIAMIPY